MAAINLEMLRELLSEFTEKELVLREERDIIEQQIVELDSRIEQNKKKLDGLSKDREKVDAMRDRYLSGNWKPEHEQNGRESSRPVAVATAPAAPVLESDVATVTQKESAAQAPEAAFIAAPAAAPEPVIQPIVQAVVEPVAEVVPEAPPRDYSKPQISGISGPAPAVTAAAPEPASDLAAGQAYASANATSQSLPAQSPTVEPLTAVPQAPEVAAAPPAQVPEPVAPPVISEPVVAAAPFVDPFSDPASEPVAEPVFNPVVEPVAAPAPTFQAVPPPAASAPAPVSDPILNALGNAPPVSAPDVMPSITPVVSSHAADDMSQAQDPGPSSTGYGAAAHGAGSPSDSWGFGGGQSSPAPDTVPGAYPPGSPMDAWGAPAPEVPQQNSAPFADIAAAADAIQVPATSNAPVPGGPGWGDFGEDWITPGSKDAAPNSTADSLPPINPAEQVTQAAPAPQTQPQAASAVAGWGDWGDGSTAQPVTAPAPAPNWGQPTPQAAAPVAQEPAASDNAGGGWGQPQPQAQPNFSQPSASNNPWGTPSPSGAIGEAAGTLPPGTPSPAFDNPWGTPTSAPEAEAKPSSLAGAAGGALLSNPRNRRRREAQPAFDWGGGPDDQAQDQGQNPGQQANPAQAQPPVADWGQPQAAQAPVADWGQPQAADQADQGGAKGEEVDEGAKKINDALRGLFKK